MRERVQERAPERTATRIPLGQRDVLTVADDVVPAGMVGRWINDQHNRVAAALKGGYQFVMSDKTVGDVRCAHPSKMGAYVTQAVGSNVTAYLMAIPQAWYDEDQAAKMKQVKASEQSISATGIPQSQQFGPGVTDE